MNYKQCVLTRPREDTGMLTYHTAWLPERFAHVGLVLDIRMDGELTVQDGWSRGWTVERVGSCMAEEYVREHERDYRTRAEASDKFTPNKGLGIPRDR